MQNLDGSIINTSLPQIAGSFGVRPLDLSVGVTAYLVTVAAVLPASGWVADRFGARRVFLAAILLFTLASLGCGLAGTLPQFVAARVVQGLGGALMTPVGRMVVLRNAQKSELLQATALITWPALLAPVIGPVLGGFITTYASWRWNFLLNLPLGLAGLAAVLRFVPALPPEARRPFDRPGFLLSAGALVLLLVGLEGLARVEARPMVPLLLTILGVATGIIAVWHLRRAPAPLVSLSALATQTFSASSLGAGFLYRIAINATPFLLPLLFQVGFGMDAAGAGLLVLAYFLGNLAMKPLTSPVLRRFGFRTVLVTNGVLGGATILACGWLTPGTPPALLTPLLFAAGLTRSMQLTCLNTLAFADIEPAWRSAATTLSGVSQQVSSVLGIAVAAVLLNLASLWRGAAEPGLADFLPAFFAIGLLAAGSGLAFLRLPGAAGAEVSGAVRSSARRGETSSSRP
ncbi:MFS transporter [Sphingomonas desiccabilis]|uniref:MFS transporter n=2 Tax=Sphingomonas desiccabilis TaxID=429134 RepID=A0A4Q2IUD3_9SPHN|nr:MFS transporter [Sphingomonas desiccabilis]